MLKTSQVASSRAEISGHSSMHRADSQPCGNTYSPPIIQHAAKQLKLEASALESFVCTTEQALRVSLFRYLSKMFQKHHEIAQQTQTMRKPTSSSGFSLLTVSTECCSLIEKCKKIIQLQNMNMSLDIPIPLSLLSES